MIRFLFRYLKDCYPDLVMVPVVRKGLHTHYLLQINGDVFRLLDDLKILDAQSKNHYEQFSEIPYKYKLKRAFLIGVFIAVGTISAPESKVYHLQMQFHALSELHLTQQFLESYQFHFHTRQNQNKCLLYLKKADDISNFLKVLDASNAVLQFENQRIKRDFRNSINRFNNIDISNQRKILDLSDRQIKQIKQIKQQGKWMLLSPKCQTVCQTRIDHPDASYQELISIIYEKFGWSISKAGLTYLFKQMATVLAIN